ncbi:WD40 repeat domain-containing protein [Mangrovimonas aestuarii]|uniref:WD40 repeat domain-containing protein n=1 Tax=Mangrovimonas aestuarii TaxID=3018443 RepID=UPI002378F606|nr:FG-GAP repeat protein [Mangrovimonas aestuarii]
MTKLYFLLIAMFFNSLYSFGQWTQIGQNINGEDSGDGSGVSVSLSDDGSIMAIGADYNSDNGTYSGHVRVYENQLGNWVQIGQDIDGDTGFNYSGVSVSLSADGDIVAIGSYWYSISINNSNLGKVKVFKNQSGNWVQIGQDIIGENSDDHSGYSVSLSDDGDIVAIGAPFNNGNGVDSGQVRVYENQAGTWVQIGQDIDGEASDDYFGSTVSLSASGNIVAIGADSNDGNGFDSGHVRVFENQLGTWVQIGQDIDGEASEDYFGFSVSLSDDGSIVAVGAIENDDNGTNSGHVRVFENQSGTWVQIGQDIDGEAGEDYFGWSVCLSGDGSIIAIGADSNDGNGSDSGHVRVFENQSGTWVQIGQDIDGEASEDYFGDAVCLSGDGSILAVGAPGNDGNGLDSGHVKVYENSSIVLSADDFSIINDYVIEVHDSKITVLTDEKIELSIYNLKGVKINNENLNENEVYILKITNEQGSSTIKKVVII